ncbi:MAG: hypothetical protein JKX97_06410 [Candidatus Lindowbacteria bacterium]|nr:hypothetical protein [Candidatus Lindowbacteria bacterium]
MVSSSTIGNLSDEVTEKLFTEREGLTPCPNPKDPKTEKASPPKDEESIELL